MVSCFGKLKYLFLSVGMSIWLCLSFSLTIRLSLCPVVCLCLSVSLWLCLHVFLSVSRSVLRSILLLCCLFERLSVCLPVRLNVCLSVWLLACIPAELDLDPYLVFVAALNIVFCVFCHCNMIYSAVIIRLGLFSIDFWLPRSGLETRQGRTIIKSVCRCALGFWKKTMT